MSVPYNQTHQSQQSNMADYRAMDNVYDEALSASGDIREHWSLVLNNLKNLDTDSLADRESKAQRILRDDGASYKSYTERERTWQLDTVPLVIDGGQWASIESGILQRSELLRPLREAC